ncbi:hypothetical protein ACLB2K_024385 [Fragaria x ananassa]
MRVRLCIKAQSKTAVVDDTDARFLQSSDFAFLYTTCFKFVFDAGLVDILLTVLFYILVSKMEELHIYIKQLPNQLQSLERRTVQLALDNDRLLEKMDHLGSEVGTITEQVIAAETNATIVKKQYIDLILAYDRLLEEDKSLKDQMDWEMVTSTEEII